MVSDQIPLNWENDEVDVRLNPRWPKEDYAELMNLARQSSQDLNLKSHIWVATSGSTAEKISGIKLVALRKEAFLNSARSVNQHLECSAQDIWAQVLPLSHVGGIGVEARSFLSGAKVVQALNDFRWDARHYYETLKKEKCTLSALVPTQVYDLVQLNLKAPDHLRAIVVGGGAFSADIYQKARALGWPVLPSYGMTETCSQIATASLESLQEDRYPEMELLSHAEARTNEEGFLEVTATSLFTCYAQWADQKMRHWDPKVQNWFRAEDKGSVVERAIHIQGRAQDYLKIGGEAVLLSRLREKLEKAILAENSEWLPQFALIDQPSERLGHEIHLIYGNKVPADGVQAVQLAYNQSVLPFEKIRQSHAVDEIPRSDLGKILYAELKKKIRETP